MRINAWKCKRCQGMAHLMVGDDLALLRIEQAVALLETGSDPQNRG